MVRQKTSFVSTQREEKPAKSHPSVETSGNGYIDMLHYLVNSVKTEIISLD